MISKLEPSIIDLDVFLDERGSLFEILRADDDFYDKFGQAYVSTINPGIIKGFHKHDKKTDYITCVSGQVRLVVVSSDDADSAPKIYEVALSPLKPKLVVITPGLWHGWKCIGTKEAILVSITTEPFHEDKKDEVRVDPINNPWGYSWELKHG